MESLRVRIEEAFAKPAAALGPAEWTLFAEFKQALNAGRIRAAEPDSDAAPGWKANAWVKQGILLGFRLGAIVDMSIDGKKWPFFDKATYPLREFSTADGVRIVPGGSSVRDGCYIAKSVTCMPPMYINVGAYVDEGTMVDSHALVGSCAQVGKRCHISAAAQIGGVLEPVGAIPVIIEDEVLVGGNCGVYEGTVVKKGAVLGSGTILTRSTPVYDLVREKVYLGNDDLPLVIPEGAVVVPGSRAVSKGIGKEWSLSLYTPVIVKYKDEKTQGRVQLEDLLR
jgi:2,3,4,5-tetrahydropyridine-2,6-dicarboxylate N-succinyltransferase